MCNILEQIEKRGEQKGRKEGFEEGREISKKETVKKMLIKNYSIDEIKEITGVSDKIIEEIKRKL